MCPTPIPHRAKRVYLQPIAGESLFSILCRYHYIASNTSVNRTLSEIFGDGRRDSPLRYLPSGLGGIAKAFDGRSNLSNPEYLAARHTALPYYGFCRSQEFKDRLMCEVIGEGTRRSRATLGDDKNGQRAGKLTPAFCPECVSEDLADFGVATWRQDHALPGVYACPRHGGHLYVGTKRVGAIVKSRNSFLLPPGGKSASELLLAFAELAKNDTVAVEWMAKQLSYIQHQTFDRDLTGLIAYIRRQLVRNGYQGVNGGLCYEKLECDLKKKMGARTTSIRLIHRLSMLQIAGRSRSRRQAARCAPRQGS